MLSETVTACGDSGSHQWKCHSADFLLEMGIEPHNEDSGSAWFVNCYG